MRRSLYYFVPFVRNFERNWCNLQICSTMHSKVDSKIISFLICSLFFLSIKVAAIPVQVIDCCYCCFWIPFFIHQNIGKTFQVNISCHSKQELNSFFSLLKTHFYIFQDNINSCTKLNKWINVFLMLII